MGNALDSLGSDKGLPPSPILYPFFCGKFFMMIRLTMAYSSRDLGTSIDYFVYQDLILTVLHILISAVLLSQFTGDPHDGDSMNYIVVGVTGMDVLKTLLMYVFWVNYQVGFIHDIFERLPSVWTRVAAAIIIHAILDVIQTLATVFTMWIAEAVKGLNCQIIEVTSENNSDERLWSFTELLLRADDKWCILLFERSRRNPSYRALPH